MYFHKCHHFHECTNHTLSETPSPPKKYTSTFFECQTSHENNKNQAKKLKVYEKMLIFTDTPTSPRKYLFCTLVKLLTCMDGPLNT